MNCPRCTTENPPEARFCLNCGTPFPQVCRNCGSELPVKARFCLHCGEPVQVPAKTSDISMPPEPSPAHAQPPSAAGLLQRYIPKELLSKLEAASHSHMMTGERRVVTILFCDVVGSTMTASRLDPEEWAEIINGAFEFMIEPIYRYEGTVARLQGDGLLAFFGAPIAHEDDPERAVLAGLDILKAIVPYSAQIEAQWGFEFNVRVGINTGLVVVGEVGSDLRVEYTALGDAINIAARMEQNAQPGTILLAEATYRLVAPLFEAEAVPGLLLKGHQEQVTAYRALKRKTERGSLRGLPGLAAPLIGRQAQLEAMLEAAAQLQRGNGGIISVIGEAGLGKSRLVSEFRAQLQAQGDSSPEWLEGRALSYDATIPFASFTNLFKSYFELQAPKVDQARYRQIASRLTPLFSERAEELAPFFATMLGIAVEGEAAERINFLPPPQLRGVIFAQVVAWLERLLEQGSVVLFLDDLHWTDPTSMELLQALLPLTDHHSLLILAAFRPHQQELAWEFHTQAERDLSHRYHAIMLSPLDPEQSRQLVASLLEIDDLPAAVRQQILAKSEGNPLFVEEVIRSLLDSQLIVRVANHWHATQEIHAIDLPDTLVGIITARLDRLDDATRHILQSAAVLGREFSTEVLGEIIETPAGLEEALTELQRRQLLLEKASLPLHTLAFKHVLTQEAAYQSILLSNRRTLHGRAADTLIARTPEAAADIARHLLEARQVSRAVPYLVQAGDQAARAYASEEAISFYRQALTHQDTIGDPELLRRAFTGLGDTQLFANQVEAALETFQSMLEKADVTGDLDTKIIALNKLANITALYLGQFQQAEQLLSQAEGLARANTMLSHIPDTNLIRCLICSAQADFENVVKFMDEVVTIGQQLDKPQYMAEGLEHVAVSLLYMLQLDEARQRAMQGLQITRQIGDRLHEAGLLSLTIPVVHLHAGKTEAALETLNQALQIGEKIGTLHIQAIATYLLADIYRGRGEYERALSFGLRSLAAGLPLEAHAPFLLVPILGCVGSIYQEISPQFSDKIAEFHLHALRLLESPFAQIMGGIAWADLGHCALALGDLEIAEQVLQKGMTVPNTWAKLERPRHLAGAALLASLRGDHIHAIRLAEEACAYAEQHQLGYHQPLAFLMKGKVLIRGGDLTGGLAALDQAREVARPYQMRPVLWQSHAAAADGLSAAGEPAQAEAYRVAAREIVAEMASLFEAQDLRQAFLQNALAKIH